jgi:alkanesulfonate monooxygenase SsuD/methylene tetrahydromethanopterin reductase-like flavin-dependent oxidoreductase (luciferase family)
MRALWSNEVASYGGRYVHLTASRCWPKPRQHPGPPVLLGGPASDRNFRRVARWADGWITMGDAADRDDLGVQLQSLRDIWKAAERDDAGPRVSVIYNPRRGAPPLQEVISVAADLGVERVLYHVFEGDRDQMLRRLDRGAAAVL